MSFIFDIRPIQALLTLSAILMVFALTPALAQDNVQNVDILPALTVSDDIDLPADSEETHPPVRLTPDKSELIRLDREAVTIIVGNPEHVSVLADTSKTLVLVPQLPGATHFTVLDSHGEVIMQRHVIIASPKERYVRIRRSCAGASSDECQETSMFFCPDMCHEINVKKELSEANDSPFDALEEMAEAAASQNNGATPEAEGAP